ncbi:MAG: hypothetical protein ABSH36_06735 [Solirubrobacteraceae bacterium]
MGGLLGLLGLFPSMACAGQVTNVTAENRVPSSAAGALTDYTVAFTTSSTGALAANLSTIAIDFPGGTGLGSVSGTVEVGGQQVGTCSEASSTTVSCSVDSEVGAEARVSVELYRVTNPGSASDEESVGVLTSSDMLQVRSEVYSVTSAGHVSFSGLKVEASAEGALTLYKVEFRTSSPTGALSGVAGSTVTVSFPEGTGLGSVTGSVEVGGEDVGSCERSGSTTKVECRIYEGSKVGANTLVSVELGKVTNAGSAEVELGVATSSDISPAFEEYRLTQPREPGTISVFDETPSSAAGALTDYRIELETSSTGALSGAAGSTITVSFPEGTGLSSVTGLVDVGEEAVGSCGRLSSTQVECRIGEGSKVGMKTHVSVELYGVTNPGSASDEEMVGARTSSDTVQAGSKAYAVTPTGQVSWSGARVEVEAPAEGALTAYKVEFRTSSTGALSGVAGSRVTVSFPGGTGLGSVTGSVDVGEEEVGSCERSGSTMTVSCRISEGSKVAANTVVSVELGEVTNPSSTEPEPLEVATSSDILPAAEKYKLTQPREPGSISVFNETPSAAAGALTDYEIEFTTSSTGALSGVAGSTIEIDFPAKTGLGLVLGTVENEGEERVGSCGDSSSTMVECKINRDSEVGGKARVIIELYGVTNPSSTGATALKVATSSDTVAGSGGYTVSAVGHLTPLTVGGTTSAAGALAVYTVEFMTSSTGALSEAAGSAVTIVFPKGTGLGSVTGIVENESEEPVGACSESTVTTASCSIDATVGAGETLKAVLQRVVNPNTVGNEPLKLATTSDTTLASSSFPVTAPNAPVGVTVDNSFPSSAPGALTIYKIAFGTSSTGALSSAAGSQITIVLPPGTGLSSLLNMSVSDATTGQQVGYCNESGALTLVCAIEGVVNAGDSVTVELNGVNNPTVTAPESVKVSTTSDTVVATSVPYGVGAPVVVTGTASNVSQTGAFVAGTVNPEDTAVTDCHFEWGSSTGYGQSVPCSQVLGSGASAEPVSAALTGLGPNTTYHFRVVATNAGGTSYGGDQTFVTPASVLSMSAPSVFPSTPPVAGPETATFSGLVDPDGLATTVYFEYGLDSKYSGGGPVVYDQRTPAQAVGSDFTGHTVSVSVSELVPNALYHFRLVAANGAGTTVGPDQTFTTGQSAAPPAPTIGETVNVKPVEGVVLVKLPARGSGSGSVTAGGSGSAMASGLASAASVAREALTKGEGFVPLTETRQVPVGSEIDSRRGTLELVAATDQRHHTNSAKLSGGVFTLSQQRTGLHKGLTTFTLDEGLFPGGPSYQSCGTATASSVGRRDARSAKLSSRVVQKVEATDNHGNFQTRGRYSAATVRGTSWSTADRCDGTFTHVRRGTVNVFDFATRKTTVLKAGQGFLAPAR